ncbi:hypothetical protein DWW91_08020 [Parabacteroides sp. AF17-3]|nr:hypothetical protein DWW91_08020 [Parabacteroides sp. AF17-3]
MIFFAFIGMNVFYELKFYPYDYNANVRRWQIADDRQILQGGTVFFKALILIKTPYENDKFTLQNRVIKRKQTTEKNQQ